MTNNTEMHATDEQIARAVEEGGRAGSAFVVEAIQIGESLAYGSKTGWSTALVNACTDSMLRELFGIDVTEGAAFSECLTAYDEAACEVADDMISAQENGPRDADVREGFCE